MCAHPSQLDLQGARVYPGGTTANVPENLINDKLPNELLHLIFAYAQTPAFRGVCKRWHTASEENAKDILRRIRSIPEIAALRATNPLLSHWNQCAQMWQAYSKALRVDNVTPPKNPLAITIGKLQEIENIRRVYKDQAFLQFCNTCPNFIAFDLPSLPNDNDIQQLSENDLHIIANGVRQELLQNIHVRELNSLDLSRRQLLAIPPEIAFFVSLERLDVSHNALRGIPLEVGRLPGLRYLWINDNQIFNFPMEKESFPKLQELHLSQNNFEKLPPEIYDIRYLIKLTISKEDHNNLRNNLLIEKLCDIRRCYVEIKRN